MPKEPKVIDIEAVDRAPKVRRIFLVLLFATFAAGLWVFWQRM